MPRSAATATGHLLCPTRWAPGLARIPTARRSRRRVPGVRAGAELLLDLGAIDHVGNALGPVDPSRFADRSDEWWAQVYYALALLVELYRAPMFEGPRLMRKSRDSSADDLLALANEDEVADLIAMRDLPCERLLPALPSGPVVQ
jgi:hypothetical protein